MQENRFGYRGGFLLISPQDQLFIGSSVPEMVLQSTPPPGVNLLHDRAMAGYRGTGVTTNAQGVQELRSEEHTSELQSLMRISYAVFCLKKKNNKCTIRCINIERQLQHRKPTRQKHDTL